MTPTSSYIDMDAGNPTVSTVGWHSLCEAYDWRNSSNVGVSSFAICFNLTWAMTVTSSTELFFVSLRLSHCEKFMISHRIRHNHHFSFVLDVQVVSPSFLVSHDQSLWFPCSLFPVVTMSQRSGFLIQLYAGDQIESLTCRVANAPTRPWLSPD